MKTRQAIAPAARARIADVVGKRPARARDERANVAERSFAILEYVAQAESAVAITDIIEALDLPKPTAYRLVDWLVDMGFFVREPGRRRISVGSRLTRMALGVLRASWQDAPRQAILEALVNQVGETCNVGVLDRSQVVYLDRVEVNHWPLRLQFGTGSRVPLHCTAMGKLFLALMPARQRRQLLRALDLTPATPQSITDPARLDEELATIRAEGVSYDREEFIAGVVCMAVPILDAEGKIAAAVALQAPTARLSIEDAKRHLPALRRTAEQLSATFGPMV